MSITLQPDFDVQAIRERIAVVFRAQQEFFASGRTRPYAFRREQLLRLKASIGRMEPEIFAALKKDLRKSEFECLGTEVGPVYNEIRHTLAHLREWMRPRRVATPLMFLPSSSKIHRDPLGTVLTIGPWNYPFLLIMTSLVSAIAGGNTTVMKPSDMAPATAAVIDKLIRETFPEEFVAVMHGPGEVVVNELVQPYHWDHIFFTGSIPVGRKIMQDAAGMLSPVTLELGGKSPCIVDRKADLDVAARKIAWGKLINAGQTCVAPDYVLVHEAVREEFIRKLREAIVKMYGADPSQSPDYPRLINQKRFRMVSSYLTQGRIIHGGRTDADDLYIEPTLLEGVGEDDPVMQEEIFGPVLPLITYRDNQEVLDWIRRNPYPLALYVFTQSRETEAFFTEHVRFGGGCINNSVIHLGNPDLPFGGVGFSGIGQYHGRDGFDTFTRPKSVMRSPTWFDAPLWYAPYGRNIRFIRFFFRK
jgi:aldehyde dehydrogenase (NAD+)